MEYLTVSARFLFFNGKERYTVEYTYGISKWFVFREEQDRDAVYVVEDKKIKFGHVNKVAAEIILNQYLEQPF